MGLYPPYPGPPRMRYTASKRNVGKEGECRPSLFFSSLLVVQNQAETFESTVEDHKGLQYPRLERNSSPDTLSEIIKPRVKN